MLRTMSDIAQRGEAKRGRGALHEGKERSGGLPWAGSQLRGRGIDRDRSGCHCDGRWSKRDCKNAGKAWRAPSGWLAGSGRCVRLARLANWLAPGSIGASVACRNVPTCHNIAISIWPSEPTLHRDSDTGLGLGEAGWEGLAGGVAA